VTTAIDAYSRAPSSAEAGEQPRCGGGRGGQHDGVCLDQLRVGCRPDREREPAPTVGARRAAQLADRRLGADLEGTGRDERVGQPGHAAAQPGEDRDVGRGDRGVEQGTPLEQRDELGHGGARGELARAAGVHPAEQRLHEPVDDLVPQPGGDQVSDGDVPVDLRRRQVALRADPGQPLAGEHARVRELVEVQRDAHQRPRQRAEGAAGPDPRGRGGRVLDRKVEGAGQRNTLRTPVQHRLGAHIDGHAGDRSTPQLAAGPRRALEDEDLGTGRRQVVGRGQPRDPSPDDDHAARCWLVHPARIPDARAATPPTRRNHLGVPPVPAP
jgi:hypothetical protein